MISVQSLSSHIEKVNRVGLTFDPNMDLRADLVRFHGYSVEKTASLTEDEVYHIIDTFEEINSGQHRTIPIPCDCGYHEMLETDYSDWDDCYTLLCPKCHKEDRIHYTAYDAMLEGIENSNIFEKEACDTVKLLVKHCSCHVNNSKEFKQELRQKGKLIQSLDLYDGIEEYYQMNGRFYMIGMNSGELIAKTDNGFKTLVEKLYNVKM